MDVASERSAMATRSGVPSIGNELCALNKFHLTMVSWQWIMGTQSWLTRNEPEALGNGHVAVDRRHSAVGWLV